MVVRIINNNFDKDLFNQKAGHPLQCWQWGEARKQMEIEVLRMGEYDQNTLINVFQLTFHKLPLTSYKIGYLPRSVCPSKIVLEFLQEYGRKNKVIFIKVEPYAKYSVSSIQYSELLKTENWKLKIVRAPHPLFPEWTQLVDLTKSEDELLKNMHPKTRYNIKLAQKKGVVVKEISDDQGFEIFSKLYFETCHRQKYFGHTKNYHQIIWNSLKKNIAHILVAFYNNSPLAAYELFYFGDRFYYPYGGSSTEYRNLMATNLIMWEAIKLGKKLGAKKFDMWGSLAPDYDQNHPWAGFTRFKEGYGGKFIQMIDSYDLVVNPTLYLFYNYSYLIRQFYLKIKKIF